MKVRRWKETIGPLGFVFEREENVLLHVSKHKDAPATKALLQEMSITDTTVVVELGRRRDNVLWDSVREEPQAVE